MRTLLKVGHVMLLISLSVSVVLLYQSSADINRRTDNIASLVWEHQDLSLTFADSHNGQLRDTKQRLEKVMEELSDMRSKLNRSSYAHGDVADALEAAAKQIRIRR